MSRRESVTYLVHATVRLDLGRTRLLTDPFLRRRLSHLRRQPDPVAPEAYAALDAVLISHLHLDHLDVPSLRRLSREPTVLVPRGGGALVRRLGYVAAGAARVYFAGDTDLYEGMARLAPLDVALLPVWGWGPTVGTGHLDPETAARALPLLRPRLAIPVHWGTLFPAGLARFPGDRLTEPPREFARHAARLAPEVRVEILPPGATIEVARAA